MKRDNVVPIVEQELAQLNARCDAALELDAEAWAAACDDGPADYEAMCRSHWRAPVLADADR